MINFCLVLDLNNISKWHSNFIYDFKSVEGASLQSVIFVENDYLSGVKPWRIFQVLSGNGKSYVPFKSDSFNDFKPFIKLKHENFILKLSYPELNSFFQQNPVDVIINLSNSTIEGLGSLGNAKEIWQLHNFSLYKSGFVPEVFQHILKKENFLQIFIKRLNSDGEEKITGKGKFKVYPFSYFRTYNGIVKDLPLLLVNEVKRRVSFDDGGFNTLVKTSRIRHKYPSILGLLKLLIVQAWFFLQYIYERGFHVDHWNVGLLDMPIPKVFEGFEKLPVHWFQSSKKRFIADSFAIENNGNQYIFFEGLNYSEGKGYISVATLRNDELVNERIILKEPFHLSYPFVFKHDNEFYCIPETNEAGCIMIYQAKAFPYEWEKKKVLVPDFRGIDTTIFQKDDFWWMFTSNKDDGPYHKLHVYYSQSLMGPWEPHQLNPVKIDITSTRGAGPVFTVDQKFFRPSQDYSQKIEGRMRINEIVKLSPTDFLEEEVNILNPIGNSSFPHKVHTIAAMQNITIIDGARQINIFSDPVIAFFKIKRLVSQVVKKVFK